MCDRNAIPVGRTATQMRTLVYKRTHKGDPDAAGTVPSALAARLGKRSWLRQSGVFERTTR